MNWRYELGKISKYVGDAKESIKSTVRDFLETMVEEGSIGSKYKVDADSLWNRMSVLEKLKWFMYKWILKETAELKRTVINHLNKIAFLEHSSECTDLDCDHLIDRIEYPNYIQPNPKTIMIVDMKFLVNQPLEYIITTFTTEK